MEIPKDGRVATNGVPVEDFLVDYDKLYDIVDVLDEIAEETGHTVAQVALNWLLRRPTITGHKPGNEIAAVLSFCISLAYS